MKTSVSVICYKYKILANGEYPIMLRVAKDGKCTMRSKSTYFTKSKRNGLQHTEDKRNA